MKNDLMSDPISDLSPRQPDPLRACVPDTRPAPEQPGSTITWNDDLYLVVRVEYVRRGVFEHHLQRLLR